MNDFWKNYLLSFHNGEEGFSRKKIIATVIVMFVLAIEFHWIWHTTDYSALVGIVGVDLGFVASLLGISSYQQVQIEKINKKPLPKPDDKQD